MNEEQEKDVNVDDEEEKRLFPNSKYLKERWNWDRPKLIHDDRPSSLRYYDNLVKDAIDLLNTNTTTNNDNDDGTGLGKVTDSSSRSSSSSTINGQPRYVGVTDILELNVTTTSTAAASAAVGDGDHTTSDPNNNKINETNNIYIGNLLAFLWQSWDGQWVDIHEAVAAYWAIHDFNHRISRFPDPKVDYEYYYNNNGGNKNNIPDLFYNDSPYSTKRLIEADDFNCPLYLTLTVRDNTDNNYVVGKIWSEIFYDLDYSTKTKQLRPMSTMGNYASRQAAVISTIAAVTTTGYRREGSNNGGVGGDGDGDGGGDEEEVHDTATSTQTSKLEIVDF